MELNTVWSSGDLIMAGLAYTVMGMVIVFSILIIIMIVIKAMALFSGEKKPKTAAVAPAQEPSQQVVETVETKVDDSELIAAITAAIAVVTEQSTSDFVVRSYKKISGGAWNKAGRREMLDNRF